MRQVVHIEHMKCDMIMNSKSEWNGVRIPRVMIEQGHKIRQKDYQGLQDEDRPIPITGHPNHGVIKKKSGTVCCIPHLTPGASPK